MNLESSGLWMEALETIKTQPEVLRFKTRTRYFGIWTRIYDHCTATFSSNLNFSLISFSLILTSTVMSINKSPR